MVLAVLASRARHVVSDGPSKLSLEQCPEHLTRSKRSPGQASSTLRRRTPRLCAEASMTQSVVNHKLSVEHALGMLFFA